MYFISLENFSLPGSLKEETKINRINEYFTKYDIQAAYIETFVTYNANTAKGWLINEKDLLLINLYSQGAQTNRAFDRRSTSDQNIKHYFPENLFTIDRTDFRSIKVWHYADMPTGHIYSHVMGTNFLECAERREMYVYALNSKAFNINTISDHGLIQGNGYFHIYTNTCYFNDETTDIRNIKPTVKLPSSLFGINAPYRPMGFEPAPNAEYNIVENGVTIAQLFDNKLVILFPFMVTNNVPEYAEFICQILTRVSTHYNKTLPQMDENFIKHIRMKSLNKRVAELKTIANRCQNDIHGVQNQLGDLMKKYLSSSQEASVLEMSINSKSSDEMLAYTKELETLKNLPRIESIGVSRDKKRVMVDTDMIYIEHTSQKTFHEIGKFRITISLDASISESVKFLNRTRKGIDNCNHPHVDQNGKPCMGTFAEMLPSVMSNGDIQVMITACMNYLESVNYSDQWGRRIECFPVVDRDTKKILDNAGAERYRAFADNRFVKPKDYEPDGVHKKYKNNQTTTATVATAA